MRRIAIIFSTLLVFMTAMGQIKNKGNARGNSSGAPDFAYPEKVEAAALKDIDSALKRGDGPATVNAMVRLGLAKAAVSSDSLPAILAQIDALASGKDVDVVTGSVLKLLQARIYTAIYDEDAFRINRRATLAGVSAGDYRLWSKDNFLAKIKALTSEALANRQAMLDTPLETYRGVVDYERDALTFYPTLYDFAAYQAIGCLEPFSDYMGIFNSRLAVAPMDMSLYPLRRPGTVSPDVLAIYHNLAEGRGDEAPAILARRNQIAYILPRLFASPGMEQPGGAWGKPSDSSREYEAYMTAYRECESSPYAIELLLPLDNDQMTDGEKNALYRLTGQFIADNPAYFNLNAVKNLHNGLGRKDVDVNIPLQGAKGETLKAMVKSRNVGKVTLKLYDVTKMVDDNDDSYFRLPKTLPAPVQTVGVDFEGEVPFIAEKSVEMTLPEYGLYVVVASFDGQGKPDRSYPVIACSDLSLGVFTGMGGAEAVTVNAVSGFPVDGASLLFRPWSRASANVTLPGTTKNGVLPIEKYKSGTVEPRLGKDIYSPRCNFYNVAEGITRKSLRGEIFTSLNLYRLGDKVDFGVVVYESENGKNAIAGGQQVTAVLRDANYQEVDTLILTTDSWGRAESSFTLPSDALTGNFSITLSDGQRSVAARRFMVSDYKLPTFTVEVTGVERPARPGDSARISGEASTFAGFPVEEADVKVQLSVRYGSWFWSSTSPVFYEAVAKSDAKGAFAIEIPAEVLASSPAPEGCFIADVAVTSADGETHEAKTSFNMGKPYNIYANFPDVFSLGSDRKAEVAVRDFDGDSSDMELEYAIKSVDTPLYGGEATYKDVKSGRMHPGDFGTVLSTLPSGVYTVRFTPVDASLADAYVVDRVTVFRPDDKECPVNTLLWLPESDFTADENGEAEITYGTAVGDAKVFMISSNNDGRIIGHRWLAPARGVDKVKVKLPSADMQIKVYFYIVSRLHSASASATVRSLSSSRAISVKTETFRDKVTPGQTETLTFKVRGANGAFPESAVILDMSNKAIDVLSPNPLNFVPASYWGRGINADGLYFGQTEVSFQGIYNYLKPVNIEVPQFEFYGRGFFQDDALNVVREHKQMLTTSGMKVRGAAKSADAKEEYASDAAGMVLEENAAMADMDGGMTGSGGNNAFDGEMDNYRPSEIPLSFFRPMLQTDKEGNLEITYTVPDANTTWVLRAMAYNRELLSASDEVQIMASKPLMVSTNAPRFLRTGDKVRLQASVMNATDSAVVAVSLCEILDVATGNVLSTAQHTDTVGAMGRSVVSVDFEAPAGVQGVIYRVKSTAGLFTDGEQTLLPVIPSEQDVVESEMFYIAPGQDSFSIPLAAVDNGRAYLKFTENPAWEVVSALPGLRESAINSSIEAASAIFSAAVAEGLMRDYPEIARALRKWRDNPSDSVLTSQLEKNEELKSILLSSTPWVSDALNQTERMQRLVLLLDGRNTARVIDRGVADLAKNVASEGGWSWTSQYPEVSPWCTARVLDMFGDLNRLGWLPENGKLNTMIENALAYYDRVAARDFSKYPKGDYSTYCYTRSKFPSVKQSTAAANVTRATVQRIIAGWKNHSVVTKGVDAIILNANGYNATARQILESLRQYATVTPEKGMWWQQLENTSAYSMDKVGCTAIILDAFALTDPGNPAIDQIRQWLVLEKTNTDWGNAVITSQVVSSILTSGKKWTVNPAGTAIRIGDKLLTPAKEEYATGAFTEQITDMLSQPATLTIDRQGDYPSFGAVVTMRRVDMDEISAVGCAELKITKRMSVFNGREWVPATAFKVGDRVKVTLILEADADMDYVVIQDHRAAGLEPVSQLPGSIWSEGLCFYSEPRDSQTNIFVSRMARGTYILDYELFASQGGVFASGAAEVQSQYNPSIAAHSAGATITIE